MCTCFKNNLLSERETHLRHFSTYPPPSGSIQDPNAYKVLEILWSKTLLVFCAAIYAPLGVPLHPIGTSFPPIYPWVVQTCDNYWTRDLVSKEDGAEIQNTGLQW